jgi:hypothetical protein
MPAPGVDQPEASKYRASARKLKTSFNKITTEGGFWDPQNRWYVYWRDTDDSIHGNNLVTPVNFMAIAYGICDDPARRNAVLGRRPVRAATFFPTWRAPWSGFTATSTASSPSGTGSTWNRT